MTHVTFKLNPEKSSNGTYLYNFILTKEAAIQIADKLGLVQDNSPSIPEELPAFTKRNHDESIFVETGFGISFVEEEKEEVISVLKELGYKFA